MLFYFIKLTSTILIFKSFGTLSSLNFKKLIIGFNNYINFYKHLYLLCNSAKNCFCFCATLYFISFSDNLQVSLPKKILGKLSSHCTSSIIEKTSFPWWTKVPLCINFTSWELFGISNFYNSTSIDVTTSLRLFSGHNSNKLIILSTLLLFF